LLSPFNNLSLTLSEKLDGLEPVLHGPYASEKALASQVKAFHNVLKDENNLVGMVFDEKGIHEVCGWGT